jgi:hypothetical protein
LAIATTSTFSSTTKSYIEAVAQQNFRDPGFLGIVNPENDAVYLPLNKSPFANTPDESASPLYEPAPPLLAYFLHYSLTSWGNAISV